MLPCGRRAATRSTVRSMREWTTERQRGAVGRDVVEQRVELFGAPAHYMQHRAEHLFLQFAGAVELDQGRHDIDAARRQTPPGVRSGSEAGRRLPSRRSSLRVFAWPRPRSPGRHGSRPRADRRFSVRAPRRRASSSIGSAMSSCRQSSRNAEQRWPAERNADVITSSITCSGKAVASTIMALMPPVSAINGTIGPFLAASA